MLKNKSHLEITISGKDYSLVCEHDSPLPDVKEALFYFLKYVGNVEDAVKAMQNPPVTQSEQVPSTEAPKV